MAAVTKVRDAGGTLRTIQQVTLRDTDGTERDIQFIKVNGGGGSSLVFQKPGAGAGALAVTIAPTSIGHALISTGAPLNFSVSATATVTGGTAPYTYAWTIEPGSSNPAAFSPTNAATTTFTATLTPPSTAGGWYDCTVTDANGLKATARIPVNLSAVLQS